MSARHSQLCVQGGPVGGFPCVCLFLRQSEIPPVPGEVSQLLSVKVNSNSRANFQDSSQIANHSHCANLLREERLIKTRRPLVVIPRKSEVSGGSSEGNQRSRSNLLARGNIWTRLCVNSNNNVTQFSKPVANPERNYYKEQNLAVIAEGCQMLGECPFVG